MENSDQVIEDQLVERQEEEQTELDLHAAEV